MKTEEAQAVDEVTLQAETPVVCGQVLVRRCGGVQRLPSKFSQFAKVQELAGAESHHAGASGIEREEVVGSDELPQESCLTHHGSVFVEPVGGVHDSEASFDKLLFERVFPASRLVFLASAVCW